MKTRKKGYKDSYSRYKRRNRGFTLIELLVSIALGFIVVSGILWFVVQLSETDRKELALTQTQQDMSFALDYMSSELKEAIYVYEGECLGTTVRGQPRDSDYCPGLSNHLQFPSGVTPVLAFWKIERVPYVLNATNTWEQLPSGQQCEGFPQSPLPPTPPPQPNREECYSLLLNRSSYTLVVYGMRSDTSGNTGNTERWLGPARIWRYELRQYQAAVTAPLNTLRQTPGYVDPTNGGVTFGSWPFAVNASENTFENRATVRPTYNEQILVDLVDWETDVAFQDRITSLPGVQECPEPITPYPTDRSQLTYSLTYPKRPDVPNNGTNVLSTSFYTCVRRPASGQTQDVIVLIRGNAVRRAGLPDNRNTAYLPQVTAQVQTRGVFARNPSSTQ
ncbi:prepilin-type N-terminal cleavage/methylation domain-containing protein [Ancylothrix sp. C2]|uniref:prepilin-type N-terminal cleavage/methylation domain-containing protein n=1 Tax=Ancylothrix sp. D3o TaxID=2953691 RepID=UPI0021BA66FC|nr:prepilin-type N-terminal cleavage/methylation domain-containing protein [Ancylothrix sp. D3o]MCT7948582.1 prepilin-type N-terminal cleavage/methylation domain-containing protein [Ancylothrix sp. D3o]